MLTYFNMLYIHMINILEKGTDRLWLCQTDLSCFGTFNSSKGSEIRYSLVFLYGQPFSYYGTLG